MLRSIEHVDAIKFDLLEFLWKNGRKYPIIFVIAKDLLIPPISIITFEPTFNVDKQNLSEVSSCLKEDILKILMCVKDWQDAYFLISMKKLHVIRQMIFNFFIHIIKRFLFSS